MTTIVSLKPTLAKNTPEPDVVAVLEHLLQRAKDGDLQSLAYATVNADGTTGTGWEGVNTTRFPMGYAISMLQARYYQDAAG